jgi:hypothetical protein
LWGINLKFHHILTALTVALLLGCTPEKKDAFETSAPPQITLVPPSPNTIRPDNGIMFKISLRYSSDGRVEPGRLTNTSWRIVSADLTPSRPLQAGEDVGHLVIMEFPTGSGESSCTYFAPKLLPSGSSKMKVVVRAEVTDPASGAKPTADAEVTVDPGAPPASPLPSGLTLITQ